MKISVLKASWPVADLVKRRSLFDAGSRAAGPLADRALQAMAQSGPRQGWRSVIGKERFRA